MICSKNILLLTFYVICYDANEETEINGMLNFSQKG